jgi:hypothetical protein
MVVAARRLVITPQEFEQCDPADGKSFTSTSLSAYAFSTLPTSNMPIKLKRFIFNLPVRDRRFRDRSCRTRAPVRMDGNDYKLET